jgi:alpha-L-fucosidase
MKSLLLTGLISLASVTHAIAAVPSSSVNPNTYPRIAWKEGETQAEKDARLAWFNDARFGMFIHWGLYSEWAGHVDGKRVGGAGEWIIEQAKDQLPLSRYLTVRDRFNPTKFDADAWVKAAKEAGMDYLVITSKHHDGFCLWDSKLTDHDVASTPWKKDLLKPLKDACLKYGVRFCLYHSIMDWHHPWYAPRRKYNDVAQGPTDMPRFVKEYLKPQVKEILELYDPGLLWFDGEWENTYTVEMGESLEAWCRKYGPVAIINNRVGKSRKGMQGMSAGYSGNKGVGDYGTPEQNIPANGMPKGVHWESCMTMNDTWGYVSSDQNWKSEATLIRNLADCASKGGNYLLNVGPTAAGEIPQVSLERLAAIGSWMQINGEAIKRTTASPFVRPFPWGRITQRDGTLYLIVFDRPADGRITLSLDNTPRSIKLLGKSSQQPSAKREGESVVITLPEVLPDARASVVRLELDGPARPLGALVDGRVRTANGKILLEAETAELSGKLAVETKSEGKSNIGSWTDAQDTIVWRLRAQPGTYKVTAEVAAKDAGNRLILDFGKGQKLEVEVPSTGDWSSFRSLEIGSLKLDGDTDLTLRAGPKQGEGVANLRNLQLVAQ